MILYAYRLEHFQPTIQKMNTQTPPESLTKNELLDLASLCASFEKAEGDEAEGIKQNIDLLNQGRLSFTDLIAMMPEEERPIIIPVPNTPADGMPVFLLQLKSALTSAFIVRVRGGSTKWKVKAKFGPLEINRMLPCFCGDCMTKEKRALYTRAIASQCRAHGIKTVFGRHTYATIGSVSFLDGESFEKAMSDIGVNKDSQRIWIC